MTALARFSSPLGTLTLVATPAGLCRITSGDVYGVGGSFDAAAHAHLGGGLAALEAYFAGREPTLPALDLAGSPFDRRVWSALLSIPWGETRSYGALASSIGMPGAARAVGAANGRNPVWILVPCHRVVAADGGLGGYAGGVEVKRWLLGHEATARGDARTDQAGRSASIAMLSPSETGTASRAGASRAAIARAVPAAGKLAASLRSR
jgi:methylated-DNA-[protein]-cysteine S-methyltransferase